MAFFISFKFYNRVEFSPYDDKYDKIPYAGILLSKLLSSLVKPPLWAADLTNNTLYKQIYLKNTG